MVNRQVQWKICKELWWALVIKSGLAVFLGDTLAFKRELFSECPKVYVMQEGRLDGQSSPFWS